MKKIIDFPRSQKITNGNKFYPAPRSVTDKMAYLDDIEGYWSNDLALMESRLIALNLRDAFVEKMNQFEAATVKVSFEFVNHGTSEIFALHESMEHEAGRYFLNYYAFANEFAFSCRGMDLYSWRLPNAREMFAEEFAELEG